MRLLRTILAPLALLAACDDGATDAQPFAWNLPHGFPVPLVPTENPMSAAKVQLGRHLFYDTRLSGNGTYACASCHHQEDAFTDERARALGSTGQEHPRSSPTLANVAYAASLGWANPLLAVLEDQAPIPMFGESPIELGVAGRDDEVMARLRNEPRYHEMFPASFPKDRDPFSIGNVVKALASFERTLLSGDSAYDRYVRGEATPDFSASARRGMELFFSEQTECFHCHGGFTFSESVAFRGGTREATFHNNGLYNLDGNGSYPADNTGLFEFTGNPADMGRMKPPTLRNIAKTAPYMHDGSIATLEEVIDFYAAGGRSIDEGPLAGDGRASPCKSSFVKGFTLAEGQRDDLVAFLESLTDTALLTAPRFADPWKEPWTGVDQGDGPEGQTAPPPTWAHDIRPLLERTCVSCHDSRKTGAARQGAPLGHDFDSYTGALRLLWHSNDLIQIGMMPPSAPLSAAEKDLYLRWATAGAPEQ